jgi:hypothetical protein
MNATPDFSVPDFPLSQPRVVKIRASGSTEIWHIAIGVIAALCAFLLYLSGVSSTVTYGGDCGELIAASYRLGIAHPTGYAL